MKQLCLKALMLLAMVWAIPIANAQGTYTLSGNSGVTAKWSHTFTTPSGTEAHSAAIGPDAYDTSEPNGSNLKIYTIDPATSFPGYDFKSVYRIGYSGVSQHSFGISVSGRAIAHDDALNVITTSSTYSSDTQILRIFNGLTNNVSNNTSSKTKVDLTTNSLTLGEGVEYMSAEGDVLNGTGYIWYVNNGTATQIKRLTIVNGVATALNSWNLKKSDGVTALTLGANENYVKKYDTGKLILHDRSAAIYDVQISGSNAICTDISSVASYPAMARNSMGCNIYVFKGHRLLFCHYNTAGTNYTGQFEVIDLDNNNAKLLNINAFPKNNQSIVGIWVHAWPNPNDGNKLDLYVYKPGVGAAKYEGAIIATETNVTYPVQNLTGEVVFAGSNVQNAKLTWSAPVGGTVTNYSVYAGETLLGTTTSLSYTASLTAETTFKVVPNYSTGSTGDASTYTLKPIVFKAPTNVTAREYEGFARVVVGYTGIANTSTYHVAYNIKRDGTVINIEELNQLEYIDTNVEAGNHTYVVEAIYYTKGTDGKYNIEIARLSSDAVTVTVNKQNTTLVNYELETVYNRDMWDIWSADNGVKLPSNFNPNLTGTDSSGNTVYIDAENYRQGALMTDKNGKKWWLIMQRSNANIGSTDDLWQDASATSGGILKISAEEANYAPSLATVNVDATLLTLPATDVAGNDIKIKSGQSSGIAVDDAGNILIRGFNNYGSGDYAQKANFPSRFKYATVYKYDSATDSYTKGYTVDLSAIWLNKEDQTETSSSTGRTDYYRLTGDIFSSAGAILYCSASTSRTMSTIELKGTDTAVNATLKYQYVPESYGADNTAITQTGYEHYVFPVALNPNRPEETNAGYIYQKRSVGYFYVPAGATLNSDKKDLYTTTGKIANSGGTTARMVGKTGATQLFIITPQSVFSKNIGGFSVGMIYENNFANPIVPVANMVQTDSHNITDFENVGNVNGNWLFAEYDTEEECIYIYQYVPGIRIAKYKLSGGIKFFGTHPDLKIVTTKCADGSEISHFTATTTWSTPADYAGKGNYDISYYKVELLNKDGKVIATKNVDARTEGTVYQTVTRTDYTYELKNYTLTFEDLDDIDDKTVETGNADNHFIDDNHTYTVQITTMFDLTIHLDDPVTNPSSDEQASIMNYADYTHNYPTNEPKGTVTVYEGTGTVKGAYRIEIDIQNNEDSNYPVSHYELSYTKPGSTARSTETVAIDDFILVTANSQTENSSKVPGTLVRNNDNGYALSESTSPCFVCFYHDNRIYDYDPVKDEGKWVLPEGGEATSDIPTNWTYNLTAVYADGNSLLRSTTNSPMTLSADRPTTGEELLEGNEEATLKAFPIPAGTTLTVQSPKGIEQITMISASGMVVKDIVGDGNTVMTINVDDLDAGYYMLRVNNQPIIKVVKK